MLYPLLWSEIQSLLASFPSVDPVALLTSLSIPIYRIRNPALYRVTIGRYVNYVSPDSKAKVSYLCVLFIVVSAHVCLSSSRPMYVYLSSTFVFLIPLLSSSYFLPLYGSRSTTLNTYPAPAGSALSSLFYSSQLYNQI